MLLELQNDLHCDLIIVFSEGNKAHLVIKYLLPNYQTNKTKTTYLLFIGTDQLTGQEME